MNVTEGATIQTPVDDIEKQISDINTELGKYPKPVDTYDLTKPISDANRPAADPNKDIRNKLLAKMDILIAQKRKNAEIVPTAADPKTTYDNKKKKGKSFNDVQYHDPVKIPVVIDKNTAYVFDKNGKKKPLLTTKQQGYPTFYKPNKYKFGASTYVPSYEDSIYLSRTKGPSKKQNQMFVPSNKPDFVMNDFALFSKKQDKKIIPSKKM